MRSSVTCLILLAMDDKQLGSDVASGRRLEELEAQVAANRAEIDALQSAVATSVGRADNSDERAAAQGEKLATLEARIDVDREVIAQLHADGLLSEQHAAHLAEALRTSRRMGAAIGIVMANRGVDEADAFKILSRASQHANRRLRLIAEDVVETGDVSRLPDA